ncbi:MAG: alpha-D-ribose 1-methylphosphonate 5-triphosphate diphosphatase [Clostridiales bacterium]|nr:alpha-D-ribose 1-methylphosphonate 5-triphosphate diphosphatase [Clostridiales bacterium]
MPITIINANIILPEDIVRNASLSIEGSEIVSIDGYASMGRVIDAEGAYLMPGMIDTHSDQIEQVVEPRTGSVIDVAYAVQEQEKQLVNQGITTMYQSLSLWNTRAGLRQKAARESGLRSLLIQEIVNPGPERLINHRLHLRMDMTNFDIVPELMEMLRSGCVSLLSFMDHTPGQGQYRDVDRFRNTIRGSNGEMSDEEVTERLRQRMEVPKLPEETLKEIAALAKSMGVSIASHDDDSPEKVDFMHGALGATISEFPVEAEIARYARQAGMHTLGGAPNVLNGKSHSGNMSATEGILEGCITSLCSDYYPPAMLQAVFKLHREYGLPLWDCVGLVTLAPAQAVGIDGETGSIAVGKTADLLLVDASGKYPRLTTVIRKGKVTSTLHYAQEQEHALRSAI